MRTVLFPNITQSFLSQLFLIPIQYTLYKNTLYNRKFVIMVPLNSLGCRNNESLQHFLLIFCLFFVFFDFSISFNLYTSFTSKIKYIINFFTFTTYFLFLCCTLWWLNRTRLVDIRVVVCRHWGKNRHLPFVSSFQNLKWKENLCWVLVHN